jgi:NAD(P)-dependent dehydrogenase (short-subunit alcohol dehydrogenase family)
MADPASEELTGAVAIVTGAAGGVGRATVELLTARGARVVAEDIDPAVETLEDERVATLQGDVAEPDTARQAVALATERFGALNVVNKEHAPRVRVNAVAPGAIDTGFIDEVLPGVPDRDATLESIAASHPLGRMARADEIAEVIAFLASPRSSIITGAILMADGGFTAQ